MTENLVQQSRGVINSNCVQILNGSSYMDGGHENDFYLYYKGAYSKLIDFLTAMGQLMAVVMIADEIGLFFDKYGSYKMDYIHIFVPTEYLEDLNDMDCPIYAAADWFRFLG